MIPGPIWKRPCYNLYLLNNINGNMLNVIVNMYKGMKSCIN